MGNKYCMYVFSNLCFENQTLARLCIHAHAQSINI
jgi:hypothetical protein